MRLQIEYGGLFIDAKQIGLLPLGLRRHFWVDWLKRLPLDSAHVSQTIR
jgi:hypothetical protein